MRCPFCQYTDNRVLESRSAEGGQSVRRRRECLKCNRRFTTYEHIEFVTITVIKRDSQREAFDRSKLLYGIVRACEKTGVLTTQIEALVDEIEAELQQRAVREVSSHEIGELVLKHLQGLSEVAYVRFASVYRQFQSIRDFVEALNHLESTTLTAQQLAIAHRPESAQANPPPTNDDDPPTDQPKPSTEPHPSISFVIHS